MELDNIVTLAGKFKSNVELQDYCNKQYVALEKALVKINELEHEVAHLKEVLAGGSSVVQTQKVELLVHSDEQTICEIQINMMKEIAKSRPLTLEETKRLDILVKNLYLAKSQNAQTLNGSLGTLPNNVSEAALIDIASTPEPQIESD